MTLIALLRHGLMLSLGWIVAAALALRHHGFLWALLMVVIWAALIIAFQRATVRHAQAIAARRVLPNGVVPNGVVPEGVVPEGVVPEGAVPKGGVPEP